MISLSPSPRLWAAWLQAARDWAYPRQKRRALRFLLAGIACLFIQHCAAQAQGTELVFADFNNQGPFNNFSGDNGTFADKKASITTAFDTRVFHGPDGASLRIDYSVPLGFCGLWHSLLGKASYPQFSLNFTNLYGPLRNSPGNPSRVENVHVTQFSFWARGDGNGDGEHQIKFEFKNTRGEMGSTVFAVSNSTNWTRYSVPISALGLADVSQMKEIVLVIEDWRNNNRTGRVYLDDWTFTADEPVYNAAHWSDDAMLDLVSQRAFSYFLTFKDNLGFALDRSTFSDMVSVGTIGFQLAAYCVGHQRGWADRADLENRVVQILENLKALPMGPEPGTGCGGYRGFYYHFLNANTGTRKDSRVEPSLYDTMLLMYGVLTCKQYFVTNSQIQTLSQELFDRVEWNWFVDHSPGINSNRFYLAWTPGPSADGTFGRHVDGQTDEALLLDILALGSRTHPITLDTYVARNRVVGAYPPASQDNIMVSWRGSLFNYFFASCWMNFETRGLDLHPTLPRDLWENDRLAILADRQFCIDHASRRPGGSDDRYATYGENAWGLTACDNLVPPLSGMASEYFAFGGLPAEENIRFGTKALQSGTIAVYGAAGSINFVPEFSIAAIRHFFDIPGLWNPLFGFGDAYSLDPHYLGSPYDSQGNPTIHFADYLNGPWVNHMTMGVNVGPILLAIENYRSRQLWSLTQNNPEIQGGLNQIFGIGTPANIAVSVDPQSEQNVNLHWSAVPKAAEYNIYSSTDLQNWTLRKSGVKDTAWTDRNVGKEQRFYYLKATAREQSKTANGLQLTDRSGSPAGDVAR